jgi:hypothetical protein
MATTTNFGWETPDDTDLVKDGAAAIRTALGGVDTSFVDLKGGTTGQILSKASNTDLDFTWTADAGAPTSLGDAAGKNKIINGAFDIWQRGTSFTASGYTSDRFRLIVGNSTTVSRQTFTPGAAPVAGYEGQYFFRLARSTSTTSDYVTQKIENVQTFAGQTVTLSFWAKADAATTVTALYLEQNFGSGGSGAVSTSFTAPSLTTSWVRYTFTVAVPSISGKTIGTSSFLDLVWNFGSAMGNRTIDIWGVQIEAGSTATAFQTATGTIQGELAACQRYFTRIGGEIAYNFLANAYFDSATTGFGMVNYSSMRSTPAATFTTASNYAALNVGTAVTACTAISADFYNTKSFRLNFTVGSSRTAGQGLIMTSNNTTNGYIDISAEL